MMNFDRCDACTAKANTTVLTKSGQYLLACGHHANKWAAQDKSLVILAKKEEKADA